MIFKDLFIKKNSGDLSAEMYKNVVFNYILRGISILLGLASTSINLSYLGTSLYGQWATIASIASWINYGDFGIGNGFRNEFAKAVANNDEEQQNKLISSTVILLGRVSAGLFCVLIIVTEILFTTNILDSDLRIPMYLTNAFFCMDLFFGVGRSAAYGFQKSWLTSLAQTTTVVFRIVCILLAKALFQKSLIIFALVNGFGGLFGNILLLVILRHSKTSRIHLEICSHVDKALKSTIVGKGIQFFVLQIAGLVLYSSDNLIINKILGSEAVTKYEMITKVYNTGENLFAILLISLWSAVTYAATQKNFNWIDNELKRLLKIWGIFCCGVIGVSLLFNQIMKIWLGANSIYYEPPLIILFAIYTIWCTFGSIFVNIANGLGRLKVQLIFSSIEAVVNIPLSIFFAKNLGMGIFGVKLATLLCCVGANVFVPIDITRYLKKNRKQCFDEGKTI